MVRPRGNHWVLHATGGTKVLSQGSKERVGKQRLLRKRKVIVEPPFGLIKEILQFRRFTVVGLEKVRVQWSLICSAFNLRKLYPHWRAGRLRFA